MKKIICIMLAAIMLVVGATPALAKTRNVYDIVNEQDNIMYDSGLLCMTTFQDNNYFVMIYGNDGEQLKKDIDIVLNPQYFTRYQFNQADSEVANFEFMINAIQTAFILQGHPEVSVCGVFSNTRYNPTWDNVYNWFYSPVTGWKYAED